MAAKKYYAVKKGRKVGVFQSWGECRFSVEGFPGAEYKGFVCLEDAEQFLGRHAGFRQPKEAAGEVVGEEMSEDVRKEPSAGDAMEDSEGSTEEGRKSLPPPGTLLAYVDGSYDHSLKKYAFGCVFLLPDGRICAEWGNGDNEQSLQHRNVTGEMLGAMYAVKTAIYNGFDRVEIYYDYEGIEKWVTGAWRSKAELTAKYAEAMRQWKKSIDISFFKVAAHTNVYYNELADMTAKRGLREGQGIPKVRKLEEMERVEMQSGKARNFHGTN